jgi:hypothetical protein
MPVIISKDCAAAIVDLLEKRVPRFPEGGELTARMSKRYASILAGARSSAGNQRDERSLRSNIAANWGFIALDWWCFSHLTDDQQRTLGNSVDDVGVQFYVYLMNEEPREIIRLQSGLSDDQIRRFQDQYGHRELSVANPTDRQALVNIFIRTYRSLHGIDCIQPKRIEVLRAVNPAAMLHFIFRKFLEDPIWTPFRGKSRAELRWRIQGFLEDSGEFECDPAQIWRLRGRDSEHLPHIGPDRGRGMRGFAALAEDIRIVYGNRPLRILRLHEDPADDEGTPSPLARIHVDRTNIILSRDDACSIARHVMTQRSGVMLDDLVEITLLLLPPDLAGNFRPIDSLDARLESGEVFESSATFDVDFSDTTAEAEAANHANGIWTQLNPTARTLIAARLFRTPPWTDEEIRQWTTNRGQRIGDPFYHRGRDDRKLKTNLRVRLATATSDKSLHRKILGALREYAREWLGPGQGERSEPDAAENSEARENPSF